MRDHLENLQLTCAELKVGDMVTMDGLKGAYAATTVIKIEETEMPRSGKVNAITLSRPHATLSHYGSTSVKLTAHIETYQVFSTDHATWTLVDRDTFDIWNHFTTWEVGVCDKFRLANYVLNMHKALLAQDESIVRWRELKQVSNACKDGFDALLCMDSLELQELAHNVGHELLEIRADVPSCPERKDSAIHDYLQQLRDKDSLNAQQENLLRQYTTTYRAK